MRIAMTGANGFAGKIIRKGLEEVGHIVTPVRTDGEVVPGGFNCLIHCARHHEYITEPITEDKWIGEFKTDVMLPYLYTEQMIRANPELNNIIIISSIYGLKVPTVRYIPKNYLAAKAAEIYMAKVMAVEYAPNIRVNCVLYGGIESDREAADQNNIFRQNYSAKTLLGHMVQPDEVAGAVKFLVSDESKGMTGQKIIIDGGYTV
jgi:hypothetical protein